MKIKTIAIMIIILAAVILIGKFSNNFTGKTTITNFCECASCEECEKLMNDDNCSEILLTQDISSDAGCIETPVSFNDKTFDCQGYKITGSGGGGSGIYLYKSFDSIIKNCEISGFNYGIRTKDGIKNTFKNIRACENNIYDVYVQDGNDEFVDIACDKSNRGTACNSFC